MYLQGTKGLGLLAYFILKYVPWVWKINKQLVIIYQLGSPALKPRNLHPGSNKIHVHGEITKCSKK